jgi:imidazolonepropionase
VTRDGSGFVEVDRLVTCDPALASPANQLGAIEHAAIVFEGGAITFVGAMRDAPPRPDLERLKAPLVTPGLVDAHTHAAFAGSRHDEYALRMSGAGYEEIAKAGGGIVSSMRAVRAASREEIAGTLRRRLIRMASLGVTTVEVKSGYGLDLENERKQLEAIASLKASTGLPDTVATYLCLHALPPEANGARGAYAARVAEGEVEVIAREGLAAFADAYVDRNAFSVDEARPALKRAKDLGLGVRLHVGQFADVGGAGLAADLRAASADHLEHVGAVDAARMASVGVRAVLLPVASFTLAQAPPPVAMLRDASVPLVVASDANPGTAPTESLPLAMALAVRLYGLTVAETILGVTREAAHSLGLRDRGVLRAGARADLVLWDLPHEAALVQPFGTPRASHVFSRGQPLL